LAAKKEDMEDNDLDQPSDEEWSELLNKARLQAEAGSVEFQMFLAQAYQDGYGVTPDLEEAKKLLLVAAEQGHAEAYYELGDICYSLGNSKKEAFDWFVKAAELGYTKAHTQLSFMCMYGHGIENDETLAFSWKLKAAELGDKDAMYGLGGSFEHGIGVPVDINDAVSWYKKAAQIGHVAAQLELSLIYSERDAIPKDYISSYAYALAAAESGSKEAPDLRAALEEKMTAEQVKNAKQLAVEMMTSGYKNSV